MPDSKQEQTPISASVVIPTIGRPELLRACLESLVGCQPRAREIIVVDGSGAGDVAAVTSGYAQAGARLIREAPRGIGRAVNVGVAAAAHDLVLVTHDDCTVAPDWVATAGRLMAERPTGMITGSVLPAGDRRLVPGTMMDQEPHDYTRRQTRALVGHNLAFSRRALLEFGGFDERLIVGEDDELCYRWLRASRSLRYQPEFRIWHHDWRSPQEIHRLYCLYARGDGMLYAKHLLAGDLTMVRYILADLGGALRAEAAAIWRHEQRHSDPRLGVIPDLPIGLWLGLRTFRRRSRS